MIEATKSIPAPLDAYETAKPDEPIFTLQGGDPLAASIIRLWVRAARMQTNLGRTLDARELYAVAQNNKIISGKECSALRVRATLAEQVSWAFDEYRTGNFVEAVVEQKQFNELDRLDIYDVRRRASACVSNFFSELDEYRGRLVVFGFITENDELDNAITASILALRSISSRLEIKRGNL